MITTLEPILDATIITKLAHLADVHIPKNHKRHPEYRFVLEQLIKSLRLSKPERIVIVGDLYHDKLNISNEANLLAAEYLNRLAEIAPVRVTRGNHDLDVNKKDERIDCIKTLLGLIQNPNVSYYDKSGFYLDENVIFVVWHHGDHFSPWNELVKPSEERAESFHAAEMDNVLAKYGSVQEAREKGGYTFVDLYHDPVKGCRTANGMILDKDSYLSIHDFLGDYAMLGDIHQRDLFMKEETLSTDGPE